MAVIYVGSGQEDKHSILRLVYTLNYSSSNLNFYFNFIEIRLAVQSTRCLFLLLAGK